MEIREVKIGELVSFIESETFKNLNPKPITDLRAISQINNPDSDPSQTALIYVTEGNSVLAFAGLLPHKINGTGKTVFSNSCWWSDPVKGRGLAIPLMMKVIEKSNSAVYLSETTPELKSVLEKTGQFEFNQPHLGVRGFIRFYFADLFLKKNKKLSSLGFLLQLAERILNFLFSPLRNYKIQKLKKHKLEIHEVSSVDKTIEDFIKNNNTGDFIRQDAARLNWYKEFPWVKVPENKISYNYPFTYYVNRYELKYFKLTSEGKIQGFFAFSYRDNLLKIPYLYFEEKFREEVIKTICSLILINRYDSVVSFHPEIIARFKSGILPFWRKKELIKYTGATHSVYPHFNEKSFIQDGDGDAIFT